MLLLLTILAAANLVGVLILLKRTQVPAGLPSISISRGR